MDEHFEDAIDPKGADASLPVNFEEKRKNSLGLQLAGDLAKQIEGEMKITPNHVKGLSFSVNFRVKEPAPLVMPD